MTERLPVLEPAQPLHRFGGNNDFRPELPHPLHCAASSLFTSPQEVHCFMARWRNSTTASEERQCPILRG